MLLSDSSVLKPPIWLVGAWVAGNPTSESLDFLARVMPLATSGQCSSCENWVETATGNIVGGFAGVVPALSVVSDNFTGWDEQYAQRGESRSPSGVGETGFSWCSECALVYGVAMVRATGWACDSNHQTATPLTPLEAAVTLSRGPLPPTLSLCLPQRKRKHTVPLMRWGRVACDIGSLPWRQPEVEFLSNYTLLRNLGATRFDFEKSLPPSSVILRGFEQRLDAPTLWEQTLEWRGTPAWRLVTALPLSEGISEPVNAIR